MVNPRWLRLFSQSELAVLVGASRSFLLRPSPRRTSLTRLSSLAQAVPRTRSTSTTCARIPCTRAGRLTRTRRRSAPSGTSSRASARRTAPSSCASSRRASDRPCSDSASSTRCLRSARPATTSRGCRRGASARLSLSLSALRRAKLTSSCPALRASTSCDSRSMRTRTTCARSSCVRRRSSHSSLSLSAPRLSPSPTRSSRRMLTLYMLPCRCHQLGSRLRPLVSGRGSSASLPTCPDPSPTVFVPTLHYQLFLVHRMRLVVLTVSAKAAHSANERCPRRKLEVDALGPPREPRPL